MLMVRLSVKFSTSVLLMELEVLPSTASCAPMELCSTRTTSSATGGSTLTALQPRNSTASMMKLPLREMLLLELQIKLSMELLPRTPMLPQPLPHQHMTTMLLPPHMMSTLALMELTTMTMLLWEVTRLRLRLL